MSDRLALTLMLLCAVLAVVVSYWPLDAKDGLVLRPLIGDESITVAINHQVKFFQYRNAEQNMLAEYHGEYDGFPSDNFYHHCFRHIDFLNTTIGILRLSVSNPIQPETICHSRGNDRSRGASVNERFSLIPMHSVGIELAKLCHNRFPMIG